MPFSQATATTAVTQIVAANPRRLGVTVRNFGAAQCFISNDRVNVARDGIFLSATEGFTFLERDGDNPAAALYAVTAAGTADLRIVESYERVAPELI